VTRTIAACVIAATVLLFVIVVQLNYLAGLARHEQEMNAIAIHVQNCADPSYVYYENCRRDGDVEHMP
jgi:hypothetical protein